MQICSKCTYIFDAGFCSLLWHNMQNPLYVCLRWSVNAKVKVQLTTSKLSRTHKFPQSEMFLQEIKKQTELWICQFSTVTVPYICI